MSTRNLCIICVTVILIGVLLWPTLYRYDKMILQGNSLPVRIYRLTGYTEYFIGGIWIAQDRKEKKIKGRKLPQEDGSKITGNAGLSGYGDFSGKIYNGSNWTITDMLLRILAKEKNGDVRWDRKFKESSTIRPFSTGSISIKVTGDDHIGSCEWHILEVYGYEDK